jgi:hypothetical protein
VRPGRTHACRSMAQACCGLYRHLCTHCMVCGCAYYACACIKYHLCAQYFLRAVFCASWTDARVQEHCAQACCGLCRHSCTHCAHGVWVAYYACTCIKYAPVHTIFSESPHLCVLNGCMRAGALHEPAVVCADTRAHTVHMVCGLT